MDLKQKFAEKLLEWKLDFLPLEESLQLVEAGIRLETTFSYVANIEEIADAEDMTPRQVVEEIKEIFGNSYGLEIGNRYDHFDEFTLEICPAPTYIDLIK